MGQLYFAAKIIYLKDLIQTRHNMAYNPNQFGYRLPFKKLNSLLFPHC